MLPCFPCSSPWESNVFPHTKGGSSEICQESGECVCWTCEETSLGGFEDNGAWAPAVVYFVHAKHFTRTQGNSRSEQRHNISLSYWKGLFHLCHPIIAMIAPRELCLASFSLFLVTFYIPYLQTIFFGFLASFKIQIFSFSPILFMSNNSFTFRVRLNDIALNQTIIWFYSYILNSNQAEDVMLVTMS